MRRLESKSEGGVGDRDMGKHQGGRRWESRLELG